MKAVPRSKLIVGSALSICFFFVVHLLLRIGGVTGCWVVALVLLQAFPFWSVAAPLLASTLVQETLLESFVSLIATVSFLAGYRFSMKRISLLRTAVPFATGAFASFLAFLLNPFIDLSLLSGTVTITMVGPYLSTPPTQEEFSAFVVMAANFYRHVLLAPLTLVFLFGMSFGAALSILFPVHHVLIGLLRRIRSLAAPS